MQFKRFHKALLSLMVMFCLLMGLLMPFVAAKTAAAAEQPAGGYTAQDLLGKAVQFIHDKFLAGEKIDGYTAYVLTLAGENLGAEKWTRNNENLKSQIEKLADLLGVQNSLLIYILANQNANGSFGPFANDYGSKAPLQALARVKADLPVNEAVYSQVQDSLAKAVAYFKNRYQHGGLTYDATGWDFDYRCVQALADTGEDLSVSTWVYNGKSLKEVVVESTYTAADNSSALEAVELSKHLAALYAVDPNSEKIATLVNAIVSKKNTVSETVYFGKNIYEDVAVLTSLGRTGNISKLSPTDQVKAINYLNGFKHEHKNSWGQAAGAAWGSYSPEEPDLTAQVLTALSYFTGVNDPNSGVYQAIQDGLTYLQDIQDDDTAAIPAQYDSTFATAETLSALKALGKTYADYAGSASSWVKKSKTKTIAQSLLALQRWNETERVNKLAGLLTNRHSPNGFDNSVYSDLWAYWALGEAEQLDGIQTEARDYILRKQNKAEGTKGSWGEAWGSTYYPDFISTAQAVRALTYLPNYAQDQQVQTAINEGIAYLQGWQQRDGGVYATPYDDPTVDTAELILTLKKLGQEPQNWKNPQGLTPVDYLMKNALNPDGSFGMSKNVLDATEALYAYHLLGDAVGNGNNNPGTPPGESPSNEVTVNIAIVGMQGELLFGPGSVTVNKGGKWGLTALGALDATGLNYVDNGGFVRSIAGQANKGMSGWMYNVNDVVPPVLASSKTVQTGDKVIWWYSTDMNAPGPTWNSLLKSGGTLPETSKVMPSNLQEQNQFLPRELQATTEAVKGLENIGQLLNLKEERALETLDKVIKAVFVVNSDKPLERAKMAERQKELAANEVNLAQKVTAVQGLVLTDDKAEIALVVPAKALKNDIEITIKEVSLHPPAGNKEKSATQTSPPAGYKPISAIYRMGPDGTTFELPVTLSLKITLPPLVKAQDLILAWYDENRHSWLAIPAVVDASEGLLLARVKHFSDFAVFVKEDRKSFTDVTASSFGWAKDAIETMTGAGILSGVDGVHFEPGRMLTRAEFANLLVKALGLEEKAGANEAKKLFKDVKAGDWFNAVVSAAVQAGLIKGYEDDSFRPNNPITREEIAVLLVRAMNLPPKEQQLTFRDSAEVSSWAKNSVVTAAGHGLIKGFEDGSFRPRADANRAEGAVMVYRAIVEEKQTLAK